MARHKKHVPYHKNMKVVVMSVLGVLLAAFIFMNLEGTPTGFMVYSSDPQPVPIQEFVRGGSVIEIVPADKMGFFMDGFEISGQVIGEGLASVWLDTGEGWVLVYSNGDHPKRKPGFAIQGELLIEDKVTAQLYGEKRLLDIKVKGPKDYPEEIAADFWDVPTTCWDSCTLEGMKAESLKLYFEIDEGTVFFLDEIKLS